MSTTQTVARGTTRLLAGLLSAKGLDFLFYMFLARQLGVEGFGLYTFAISFTLIFNIGADLGTTTIVTREVARAPERVRTLLAEAFAVKLVLALATIAFTFGAALVSGARDDVLLLISVFVAAMLVNSAAFLFEGVLKAVGRAGAAGLSITAQSITGLVIGLGLVFAGWGAVGGATGYLCGALVHLAAAAWWSRGLWRGRSDGATVDAARGSAATLPEPRRSLREGAFALLRESAPLALSGAFIAVYFRIDAVLLKFFHGEAAVGFYGGAHRFFEGLVLVSAAYRAVIYPVMARAADGPRESLSVLCRKSLRLHLMFTIGVAVFVSFQSSTIVNLLLGEAYRSSAPALALLIWALPGAFMADTLLHLLTAQRRQSVVAAVLGLTAACNVALNLAVIPRFSFVGSAGVAVITEALGFALMFHVLGRSLPNIGFVRLARAPVLAGAMAAAALALLAPLDPGGAAGLALMALFAASAYMISLVVLGAVGRPELELVRSLLPGPRQTRGS